MQKNALDFVFFGSSNFSVLVLEELKKKTLAPRLVVTTPDSKKGRGLSLVPTPVKTWAEKNNIPLLEPQKLDASFISSLPSTPYPLFVVASYGKIIPESVLKIPQKGTLNVHPSLLPKYRGPSPIQYQVLSDDKNVGVTIMLLDAEVDHGPIIASLLVKAPHWPMKASELEPLLGRAGGELLADVIPGWLDGSRKADLQDHENATFTKKINKEDGLIDISSDHRENFLRFSAFDNSVGTYFFADKKGKDSEMSKIRVKIIDADFKDGVFNILKVIPEGGREMKYTDFLRGLS